MNEEDAFDKLFCSLALSEYKTGNFELYPSDLRDLWYVKRGVRANRELAEYLLKACIRMNQFYPGIFEIRVDSLEGRADSELIGWHRISHLITDNEQFRSLIRKGEFAPPHQGRPGLNLVETSILGSELNRSLATGKTAISKENLTAIAPTTVENTMAQLLDWQSKGYVEIQANPLQVGSHEICIKLLKPIPD